MTTTHGMTNTPEYRAWKDLKKRCNNKNIPCFHRYGGRGISVCEEWASSFMAFYDHIGPRPGKNYSVDRIDNDGNYEPGNVRWATRKEQVENSICRQHSHRAVQKNSNTGITGVFYNKKCGQWVAQIKIDGNHKHLGMHRSLLDACCARKSAEIVFKTQRANT